MHMHNAYYNKGVEMARRTDSAVSKNTPVIGCGSLCICYYMVSETEVIINDESVDRWIRRLGLLLYRK